MRTLRLTLQYDGTDYVGWQRQPNGLSIQELVESALAPVAGGRRVPVIGAGRTDAGVHALGQVASFRFESAIDRSTLGRALNAALPPEVRVIAVEDVADGFHARYSARSKTYRYRLLNQDVASPFERRYAWHVPARLNFDAIARAVRSLEGRHDFAAFQSAGGDTSTTVRTLFRAVAARDAAGVEGPFWMKGSGAGAPAAPDSEQGQLVCFEFCGDGFLRHMVRAIVGTLVEIGAGRRVAASLAAALRSGDRRQAGPTAPAQGLFLVRVDY